MQYHMWPLHGAARFEPEFSDSNFMITLCDLLPLIRTGMLGSGFSTVPCGHWLEILFLKKEKSFKVLEIIGFLSPSHCFR